MQKSGGGWKVTDQATNGNWGSAALQSQYQSRKGGGATPIQALRQIVGEPEPKKRAEPKQDTPAEKSEGQDLPF
jgi:hypothetical protein